MGDCLLSNFDLANSILIDPTLLEISKLSMLEFFFAVFEFSYCTFQLANIFCILSLFWDYPQRCTQDRFGFSVVTSLLAVESISRQ